VVDGQCVPVAAARGRQQHGHVDERILVHEIEQVLEETGVGAPEDGTGDQQQVSRLESRRACSMSAGSFARCSTLPKRGAISPSSISRTCAGSASVKDSASCSTSASVREGRCRPPETATILSV